MNPETGMTTYFKPMGTGYFKAFGTPTNSFWCCTGTGMENFTRTQTTDLPLTNKVTLTIAAAPTDAVNLQFRRPDWAAGCAIAVVVNGQTVTPTEAKGFLGVSAAGTVPSGLAALLLGIGTSGLRRRRRH